MIFEINNKILGSYIQRSHARPQILNKTDNVRIYITLRRVLATVVVVEKQKI